MSEGEVLLMSLPQADGQTKLRPVICLRVMPPFGDLLVCGISTQLQQASPLDEAIAPGDADFRSSGLKKPSLIRLGFLMGNPKGAMQGRLGRIDSQRLARLQSRLATYLTEIPRPQVQPEDTKLRSLLRLILASDNFNTRKLHAAGIEHPGVSLRELPFTTKAELLADRVQHPPFGSAMTEPLVNYTRFCQTSGTSTGQPMAWVDTPQSWQAMLECWRKVFHAAGLKPGEDRVFTAFAFGPFLGFWTAFEAASTDYLAIPGGGLSSQARLQTMARYGATTLCCTPTYAVRLGEMIGTAEAGVSLADLSIGKLIVAGEPGGNVPGLRQRLEKLWNARVFDHHGMTEVGPVSFESVELPGHLQIIEEAYAVEVIGADDQEVAEGEHGELVLTTLNRTACPLLRYRTGDWVKKRRIDGRLCLEGGVLGRVDEMVVVRGVNLYPSAVEGVVRQFPEVAEFQVVQQQIDAMDEVEVRVELLPGTPESLQRRIEDRLRDTFAMRIPVCLTTGLPRFEFKAKRWVKV
jgi:phenylacetate-CoA ligase